MTSRQILSFLLAGFIIMTGCGPLVIVRVNPASEPHTASPAEVVSQLSRNPILPDPGISILWIGHASVLIQIHDKIFLTDPVFSNAVGMLSSRAVPPGLIESTLDHVDFILVSHPHFDHMNYGSLHALPKEATLLIPAGAVRYTPEFGFRKTVGVIPWNAVSEDGVRITAVPARHFGGRYGFDALWSSKSEYSGYVIQYKGKTVYFAGDTGYDDSLFAEIGKQYSIDVALLPIAPTQPPTIMSRVHLDPPHALQAFLDLRAQFLIPIHHGTFFLTLESQNSTAREELERLALERNLRDRVFVLKVGEQKIVEE